MNPQPPFLGTGIPAITVRPARRQWPVLCCLLIAFTTLLLLSGCSTQNLSAFAIQPQQIPLTPGNRIVIQGFDGNIFTVEPDGGARAQITDDASAQRQYQQPTWSPDGTTLALARVDEAGARLVGALVLTAFDGRATREIPVQFPPFYIFWSPSGERIAYLSNWQGLEGPSMALRLLDVTTESADTIAEGMPYYFSWSPSSEQWVAHVSDLRLEIQDTDGKRTALVTTGGGFAAPQWSADGAKLLYGIVDADGGHLVIADTDGQPESEITTFDERISFLLNATGDQVAYVLSPAVASANTFGPLYITELDSGRTRQLTDKTVLAYHWSPDGTKLAYLATEESDSGLWLRWSVWDGEQEREYPRFRPSRTFLERYLVFSDQYAQSMRVWSPDGMAFVYAGTDETGQRGIWVQEIDATEPRWIAGGVMASWSPR